MGIGISSFTEVVGAGPSRDYDILGIKMFDSAEIRIHPTGKAIARFGTKSQGQGHETTYAQIIAEELGMPGRGHRGRGRRHRHRALRPGHLRQPLARRRPARRRRWPRARSSAKARKIAAHLLEVGEDDLEWNVDQFQVKGSPEQAKTIQEIAFAAYTNHPQGMEAGLEAVDYYDPPNLTFPFGSYICVVDIDKGTGEVKIRRFVAVDDCGNIINPMIVEGQIHGGLTMGLAPALFEEIVYDENGNILSGTLRRLPAADRRWRRRSGRSARRSRRRRTTRSAPRAWASRHGRRAAGDRQRGRRCAVAPRRAPHRHPDHAAEGVEAAARATA